MLTWINLIQLNMAWAIGQGQFQFCSDEMHCFFKVLQDSKFPVEEYARSDRLSTVLCKGDGIARKATPCKKKGRVLFLP